MEKTININEHEITSSDRNVKENIILVKSDVADKTRGIPFYSFNYKDDINKHKVYGVIAQEVEDSNLGELIYDKGDGTLAVDYTSLFCLKLSSHDNFLSYVLGKCLKLEKEVKELKEENKSILEKINDKKD